VYLPGSHGTWRGVATAESWGGGMRVCNKYAYRFRRVAVARNAGGSWHLMNAAYRMHQGDNHLVGNSSSFVARTTTLPESPKTSLAATAVQPAPAPAPAPAPKPADPPAPTPDPAPAVDVAPTPDPAPAVDAAPSQAVDPNDP
jgi:cell division septation protein DedD